VPQDGLNHLRQPHLSTYLCRAFSGAFPMKMGHYAALFAAGLPQSWFFNLPPAEYRVLIRREP
jgi:hypothetical protein